MFGELFAFNPTSMATKLGAEENVIFMVKGTLKLQSPLWGTISPEGIIMGTAVLEQWKKREVRTGPGTTAGLTIKKPAAPILQRRLHAFLSIQQKELFLSLANLPHSWLSCPVTPLPPSSLAWLHDPAEMVRQKTARRQDTTGH